MQNQQNFWQEENEDAETNNMYANVDMVQRETNVGGFFSKGLMGILEAKSVEEKHDEKEEEQKRREA